MKEKINFRPYIMLGALVAIWLVFAFTTDGLFLTNRNFSNLMRQTAIVGLLATGMVLIIVTGHIDLSVGSVVAFTGGVAAILNVWSFDFSSPLAIIVALGVGVLIGALNGWLVAYANIPAFIVTLGGMLIYRGAVKGSTKGETVGPLKEDFQLLGGSFLPKYVGYIVLFLLLAAIAYLIYSNIKKLKEENRPYTMHLFGGIGLMVICSGFFFALNSYKGLPYPVLILLVIATIVTILSSLTPFGRHVYALGGNKEAAFYSGIDIRKNTLFVFMIMGFLAAVAGVVYTAQLGNATANAGRNLELDAIAACVIGGTSLIGGKGTIPGALLGALIMASLDNGMILMNVQDYIQDIIKGLILVTAVWLDVSGKK